MPSSSASKNPLTVAVTGPTGTFGFGLMPLLQAEKRIGRIVGIARRPFYPEQYGWSKMEYRRGDVRDADALENAFAAADVVIHLAFMITGNAPRETIRAINVEGTLNTFRAAATAGAKRFVYASSVAAYGFHRDNPVGMTEQWPTRPADRLFYAQEKAEIEEMLRREALGHRNLGLYLLRPPIVLGPHAVGAKDLLPGVMDGAARKLGGVVARLPLPVPAPNIPMQFIHEEDVGQALAQCALGAGPPGAYNIAADDVLTGPEVARARVDGPARARGDRAPRREAGFRGAHAPVCPAGHRMGRGREPPRDHGRLEGQGRAGLEAALQRGSSAAGHRRRLAVRRSRPRCSLAPRRIGPPKRC